MIQIAAVPILIVLKKIAGCTGGLGHGNTLSNGIGSGGGHGGTGGEAFYNDNHVEGGYSYGNATLPCELGSGSGIGNSTGSTAGGGIIGKPKFMFGSVNVSLWIMENVHCHKISFLIHILVLYFLLNSCWIIRTSFVEFVHSRFRKC